MYKVLLVEDNQEIAGILCDFYESLGMEIDYASNGEQGLKLAQEGSFDIIILDLMLPRMNGLTLCNELREGGKDTPVLMLTALDNTLDMLKGFKQGADDYLTKPFKLDILEARSRALIRRYRGTVVSSELKFGPLTIVPEMREAYREGQRLKLNPTAYTILKMLCQKAPEVVSREEIVDEIWPEGDPGRDVLRSHIYQLRGLLDKPFSRPMLITIPKVGFRLEDVS
ncbi:response regulator transcription factor [Vibrio sp. JC009]|uniref:response regulator transcription factor n=1 Tax=Vibrio sp. JC009 TaxID=2912314 RepID=UPI0023B05BF5|nr:response regulator transcription factor [Vibrio sp. JC009]WED24018.1 response regulator transcription factor [Vibrio sp. JC009]